ncbi:MAG: hypothetical protein FJ207_00835 [Gemmatimonadetes bacterium]|nr:hypothetical protein [Gemmatimonadota bacterium]
MSSSALTVATTTADPNCALPTVMFATPGSTPERVAFADSTPCGMNTVDEIGFAMVGALDTTLSVMPPVGAGCDSVMGSDAVPP